MTDLDTLGTLARYRREGQTEPLPFGVYGAVTAPGPATSTVRPSSQARAGRIHAGTAPDNGIGTVLRHDTP